MKPTGMAKPQAPVASRRRRPKHNSASAGEKAGEQYHSRAVTRALDVLECFSDAKPRLALVDMSALIGLPESSLFRLLLTLQSRGYLQQNRDGTYELTQKVLQGKLYEQSEKLRDRVRPILQDLASRFDETASLAYLFLDRIQAIDTVETFQEIRMTNKPGRVLPPHCSSMGKAITANQERSQMDRILETYGLMKRTDKTLTDRAALLAEFEQIRQQGYALDREESVSGGFCIAAPISGARVVAAMSVSTPVIRMTKGRQHEIVSGVMAAAERAADALSA